MSRLTRIGLLVLAFLLLLAPVSTRADPLIPGRPAAVPAYTSAMPLQDDERFPPYVYTFEGEGQLNSIGHQPIYFWMNELLVVKAWLLKLALRVVEYALVQDFLTPLLERAAQATAALGEVLWSGSTPLVVAALSLTGLWAVALYLQGRASRVWASLGGSVAVLAVAAILLTAGADAARTASGLSRDLTRQVYGAVENIGRDRPGWGLVARAGDGLWRTLVYQPWVAGEFGAQAGEQTYGQLNTTSFLAKTPVDRHLICGDQNRMKTYCPWWGVDFLPRRMLIAGWTFLATAAVSGSLLALAGGIILAQLALLFLLALSPLWLVVALWWPEQGRRLLSALWLKALGALVTQVVLAVTLGVLLLLTLPVATAFTDGWMLQSLVLTGLAILSLRYRTAWLESLGALPRGLAERAGRAEPEGRGARGRRPGLPAAATAPAPATVTALAPFFAHVAYTPAGSAEAQAAAPGLLPWGESQAEPALSLPQPNLVHFQREVQVLREQVMLAEHLTTREHSHIGLVPGEKGWSALPDSAGPAGRSGPASRERISEVSRIPSQRPRG
jgi:hypothetical protein